MFKQIKTESSKLSNSLKTFHAEERGASGSVDNIMMIFVAAIILIALVTLVNDEVWTRVTEQITELLGSAIG